MDVGLSLRYIESKEENNDESRSMHAMRPRPYSLGLGPSM
jgi:hypothetical protein